MMHDGNVKSALFATWSSLLDSTNGASVSARSLARGLARRWGRVSSFCGAATDDGPSTDLEDVLKKTGIRYSKSLLFPPDDTYSLFLYKDENVQNFVFRGRDRSLMPSEHDVELYLGLFEDSLRDSPEDIVVTYGGGRFGDRLHEIARKHGCKIVFLLQNLAYNTRRCFDNVDLTIVPSRFAAEYYRDRLGIDCIAIPPPIEDIPVRTVDEADRRIDKKYVLFVNPLVSKGSAFFLAIARELGKRRPEIRFLVVEGSAKHDDLSCVDVNWRDLKNVMVMKNTPNPGFFYERTKITIVPSLVEETYGRVAVESAMAGVPAIVSDRGALPEVAGDTGLVIKIPPRYTPDQRTIPSVAEIEPWLETIVKLWDDPYFYAQKERDGRRLAERASYLTTLERYEQAFNDLLCP